MRMVIKFVLYALVIVLLVSWVSTVIKSCGNDDPANTMSDTYSGADTETNPEEEAIMDELLQSTEEEASSEEETTDNSPDITSIDYSKKLDKEEEAMLKEVAREKQKAPEAAPQKETAKSKPSSSTNATPAGDYFVITGSFGSESNAKKQRDKLRSMGYSGAEVVQFDGSKFYSVLSGRYMSKEEAGRVAEKLKSNKAFKGAYVKKKEL